MKDFEKETTILYNEADKECLIYTHQKKLISRLDKLCKQGLCKEKHFINFEGAVAKEYIVPKNWVSIRPPKKINFTEEQRKRAAERLALGRQL